MTMPPRPYFKSNIADLERLFHSSKDEIETLQALHNELQHRSTNRAIALRSNVEQALRGKPPHTVTKPTPDPESPPSKDRAGIAPTILATPPSMPAEEIVQKAKAASPLGSASSLSSAWTTLTETQSAEGNDRCSRNSSPHPSVVGDGSLPPTLSEEPVSPPMEHPGADSILAAWLTLEVLTPQPMPNQQDLEAARSQLIRLEEIPEPWHDPRFGKHGRERAVFWLVYLGEIELAKALETIVKVFPDDASDERSEVRGRTTLAVIVLDARGRPVIDRTFLSSFAWGYGRLRAGKLKELAGFIDAEHAIKADLESRLIIRSKDGEIQPLGAAEIDQTIEWLIHKLNIPTEEVLRPGVAIRVPQWGLYNEAPTPELLNSFFIEDLVKTRKAFNLGDVGQALSAYMRVAPARSRQDVIRSKNLLSETLAPTRMPLARWPSQGRYPLVLMQQAAINHAADELKNSGLIAVNGPPGTGKTTLLRDIVAKVVLDRAIAMSKFEKPETAFEHVTTMRTGQAYSHLYRLHHSLHGHEIVVASSNNKAVENVSREIPSSSAVANDFNPPLRYFQSIADAVAAGNGPLIDGATWGLAAAVLGNAANRAAFINSFWWHKKRGMALYLKAVTGGDVPPDDDEKEEYSEVQEILDVVSIEQPPRSEIDALQRWRLTRSDFLAKLKIAEGLQKRNQEAYEALRQRPSLIRTAEEAERLLAAAKQTLGESLAKAEEARRSNEMASAGERKAIEDRDVLDRLRPGFFARLFCTRTYRQWRNQITVAVEQVKGARLRTLASAEAVDNSKREVAVSQHHAADAETKTVNANRILSDNLRVINIGRKLVGANFADDAFWAQNDIDLQCASPWICEDLQASRDELFAAAFALHRAFIDASAKYLRHNLRAALDLMRGRTLSDKQEPARRSLWATLFLAVPVVSTTFASTGRLLGSLGKEELGWLLIDEAGQAVPQASVGALWRAKRAIVIGDPLQIQPVVTIPPRLIRSIFREFNVEADEWAGPDMSAQALADRVSWFGTSLNTADGDLWIGSPLRVHRRCEEPMFKISNHVAYDGLMVYGTRSATSNIGQILGKSVWINVEGEAVGKWAEDEGRVALHLLLTLLDEGLNDPDIFVITPFRIVSAKLREMVRRNPSIAKRLPGGVWDWTNNRIGTIHTFQGKEADSVVLVLGAPLGVSVGARRWAGHPPNLLNVAVTRAKRRLYVVGSHRAWKDAGAFAHLAQCMPVCASTDYWQSIRGKA
ncbi:MAG: Helicase [Nitrospira sp.]|nr:MAG: Helicase [Nitrospira sp.]